MAGFPHTFATYYPSISLSDLDANFSQLSSTSTSTVSLAGAALIGFLQSGTGAVATNLQAWARNRAISVFDFMTTAEISAVQAGAFSTDVTTAVSNWLTAIAGKSGYAPAGGYKITSSLTLPANTTIYGAGRDVTIFKKYFNGDLVAAGSASRLTGVYLAGNGGTYTGRGITYGSSTPLCTVDNSRIIDFNGYCVEFTADSAGSQFVMDNCEIYRTTLTNEAIKMPVDTASAPRKFTNIETSGGNLADLNGAQNVLISNSVINAITYGSSCAKVLLHGVRVATVGGTTTILGTENTVTGCAFAGSVVLASGAKGCHFDDSNVIAAGYTITDTSGSTGSDINYVDIPWTSYTPTWTCSVSAPSLGNGTITGIYTRKGKRVTVNIEFVPGSTTTFGSGEFRFTIPFTAGSSVQQLGSARILDSGTTYYSAVSHVTYSGTYLDLYTTSASGVVTDSSPMVWANGDNFIAQLEYDVG